MSNSVLLPWERDLDALPIAQRIAALVTKRIVEQEIQPGAFLTETELAAHYQASRTPAREAMLQLERWGLIRIMPKKGAHVNTVSIKDVADLSTVRKMFESEAVAQYALSPKADPELGAELQEILEAQHQYLEAGSLLEFAAEDYRFHARLIKSGGNTVVMGMLNDLGPCLARLTYQAVLNNPHFTEKYLTEHTEMARLALAGDVQAFSALARQHVFEAHFPFVRG